MKWAQPSIRSISPNLLVPWYLITSYLYYYHDTSIISDFKYDELCKRLLNLWPLIKHDWKRCIDKKSLEAGTGYYLRAEELPPNCKSAARGAARVAGLPVDEPQAKPKLKFKPKLKLKTKLKLKGARQ